jgi:hypothetical protein
MRAHAPHLTHMPRASWQVMAGLAAGFAVVLTAVGTFWDIAGNDSATTANTFADYWPVLLVVAALTAVVFWFVVRTSTAENASMRALVLAVLACVSVVVFWTGAPAVLAIGALATVMMADRDMQRTDMISSALSFLALAAAVVLAITG